MGREVENVEFKGSRRRRETRIYARGSDAALLSPARPSRNIVILEIFVVPAKKKGSNVRWKRPRRPNLSFKEGASVVRVVGAIETRGRIRFPFRLKLYPLRGRRGLNRLLGRLNETLQREKKRKEEREKGITQLIP